MRRLFALTMLLGIAAGAAHSATAPPAEAPPTDTPLVATSTTFVVSGRGYGHGVGLSQWGAQGQARAGVLYPQILAHYYPGTTLGQAEMTRVRVLVADEKNRVVVSSAVAFRVTDASGATTDLAAGEYPITRALELVPDQAMPPLLGPFVFRPGKGSPVALDGIAYRGTLDVRLSKKRKLAAINALGLESYLAGVVPREMPSTWHPEALKAQAVAARSYALSHLTRGEAFDLFGDVRSQVYGGLAAERPTTTAALRATAGQAVLYRGKVADTLFFSSSGGTTAAAEDVFKGAKPVPYLVSVPDPADAISPHHRWGPVLVQASTAARALKLPGQLLDLTPVRGVSPFARAVTAATSLGPVELRGPDVRFALGLRSARFTVAKLSLSRPAGALPYGAPVRLTGSVRGLSPVTLEQGNGSLWGQVAPLSPAADGTFSVTVRPTATTQYRLTGGAVAGAELRVPVAPQVLLDLAADGSGLAGTVAPAIPAAAVTIEYERGTGSSWAPVATARLDDAGSFNMPLALEPGSYRASVGPSPGLVAGKSTVLAVE